MSPETYDAHKSERISHLEELLSVHQSELSEARKEQDRLRGMLEVAGGNTTRLEDNEDDTASSAKVKQSAKELLRVNAALLEGKPNSCCDFLDLKLISVLQKSKSFKIAAHFYIKMSNRSISR